MNLTAFRARRQQRRPARREITAGYPEEPRLPVPAVQQQYQRESGPQAQLRALPPGARPAEDVPRRPSGPQSTFTSKAELAVTGQHPLLAPNFTPVAPPRRERAFADDMHNLKIFAVVARQEGWAGLHTEQPPVEYRRRSTDRWFDQALSAIGAAADAALMEAHARLAQAHAEAHKRQPPALAPVPVRAGTGLREALANAIWKAAQWYAHVPLGQPEAHRAGMYASLCDDVTQAADDGLALLLVRAALSTGRASVEDIAPPGSPLERFLTGPGMSGSAA